MPAISTPSSPMDFRTGVERVSYAASGQTDPTLPSNRPSLSEQAVPSRLAGLFADRSIENYLTDALRPRESTSGLLGTSSYGGHLANLQGKLNDLRAAYPRRDDAFQTGLRQLGEDQENIQLLEALRRVMIGG